MNTNEEKELCIKEEKLKQEGLKRRANEFGVTVKVLEFLAKEIEKYNDELEIKPYV